MRAEGTSFQDVIMRLQRYWTEQGCLLWHPYSEKVGAGTANPATVLRVLGPEPWNVAYVEPSYRTDDGRYAENPNRMQMHTQFQVILKPAPDNPLELYLGSLKAIGFDLARHDVRFVEDNWESPALGAWGLGWEVWLDGLEITQYTYFQQAGGFPLNPISVEITYGLERIIMYLQGVREVWQIDWDGRRTYGDLLRRPEVEHCVYDFEVADVGRLRQMYDLFEAEAKNALSHGLVIPAHDYVLRCSHAFNLLDSRGAIGVTERAHYFARMRDIARQVSVAYAAQREQEEYPWLVDETGTAPAGSTAGAPTQGQPPAQPALLLFEVGTEELPHGDLTSAIEQWRGSVPRLLDDLHLAHGAVTVTGAPRRLVLRVEDVAPRQPDQETAVKGPPAERAYDASGALTNAGAGFARSRGLDPEALEVREEGGKRYVFATVRQAGRPAAEVLAEALPSLLSGLRFGRAMRWNASGVAFSRPVRWLVPLLGDYLLPVEYAGVRSGRATYGHRGDGSPERQVEDAASYAALMAELGVLLDRDRRRELIQREVQRLAATVGGAVPDDPGLLDEVTNLVESPTALLGQFEAEYLELPREVLVTVMKKHQRYFPVVAAGDPERLLPYFIAVRNGGEEHLDEVRRGNEGVIRARYADASFFYRRDTAQPLDAFTPRLATLTFQEKLGSMLDKVKRIEQIVERLAPTLGVTGESLDVARRAAALCKSDLVTSMVVELTSLQGIIGRQYALLSGEKPAVAQAIFEHYLPRFQGDATPASEPGRLVSIANRLDSMVGLFAAGFAPTGSADPFGLRREAAGLVSLLIAARQPFDLRSALAEAADVMPIQVPAQVLDAVAAFVRDRLYVALREEGLPHDVVTAVLAEQAGDPYRAGAAAHALASAVAAPGWTEILTAYARCKRIVRSLPETLPLDLAGDTEPATGALAETWAEAQGMVDGTVEGLIRALGLLQNPVNTFFTNVLVMADDQRVRNARLALIQRIAALPDGIADLSQLQGF